MLNMRKIGSRVFDFASSKNVKIKSLCGSGFSFPFHTQLSQGHKLELHLFRLDSLFQTTVRRIVPGRLQIKDSCHRYHTILPSAGISNKVRGSAGVINVSRPAYKFIAALPSPRSWLLCGQHSSRGICDNPYFSQYINPNSRLNSVSASFSTLSAKYCNPFLSSIYDDIFHFSQRNKNGHLLAQCIGKSPCFCHSRWISSGFRRRRKESELKKDSLSSTKETDSHNQDEKVSDGSRPEISSPVETTPTLYQRFKKTYKEHGKVLIAVHLVTSAAWFSAFYTAARCGLDIVPYLENWNLSEKIISPFRSGGLGDIALAYLMYKLATPARYTVTIGGTNLAIRYLRQEGKMKPVPSEDTLRSLYKEGKANLKHKSANRMTRIRTMRTRIRNRVGKPKNKRQ